MDLLKTPSVQSLLDSDIESVESLHCLDIEELDEVEYALPASEAPTLAEVLSAEDGEVNEVDKTVPETAACSALQVDFLQGISQQLSQAQERCSAGFATALSATLESKVTVGTAHGHLLSFQEQILRWVCDSNVDRGAVSCLAYNNVGDRLLAGFARGLICQYESSRGVILRRLTLGGETWGILRVTWAGASGLALDTGGSVWLVKFSRPLGVRSARTSCLFSGARGEVVAMAARDARVLALATLARVVLVAGGRAAGVRLGGPPDTLPVLAWCETDDRLLLCARAHTLQWLTIEIGDAAVSLRPVRRFELKSSPLWLGWISGSLAIFDVDENLRLWGDDYEKPLDLSQIEPVYASAFFKGVWTDGRVSGALAAPLLAELAERPHLLSDTDVADQLVKLCLKLNLSEELWSTLWERCSAEDGFVCALGRAVARGEESARPPSPLHTQALVERLAQAEPPLVHRVLAALPLTALDPHRASVFARDRGLWLAVGAVAAALGGCGGAMRELSRHVAPGCGGGGGRCACAGDALLLVAADALAGGALPEHGRPSARHLALHALLGDEGTAESPLRALVGHDARSTVRLLQQTWCEPPFAGPLAKHNRLRVARALLHCCPHLQEEQVIEVVEFIATQMSNGTLPRDGDVRAEAVAVAERCAGERADRALRALGGGGGGHRPRTAWWEAAGRHNYQEALRHFFDIADRSEADVDELFDYLTLVTKEKADIKPHVQKYLKRLIELRPEAVAVMLSERYPDLIAAAIQDSPDENTMTFARRLLDTGALEGDAVVAYFTTLCVRKPSEVKRFLRDNPAAVRPEDALKIVQEVGPREAEPSCLEASGDPEGALSVLLELMAERGDDALVEEASALCAKAGRGAARDTAARMWTRLASAARLGGAALLGALSAVGAGPLLAGVAGVGAARALLAAAAGERRSWRAAARVLARELHAAGATARRRAGRGAAGGARCRRCLLPLAGSGAGARLLVCAHGGRTHHASCPPPPCRQCRAPCRPLTAPRAPPPRPPPPPRTHELHVDAPPRPDLEGLV